MNLPLIEKNKTKVLPLAGDKKTFWKIVVGKIIYEK